MDKQDRLKRIRNLRSKITGNIYITNADLDAAKVEGKARSLQTLIRTI